MIKELESLGRNQCDHAFTQANLCTQKTSTNFLLSMLILWLSLSGQLAFVPVHKSVVGNGPSLIKCTPNMCPCNIFEEV